MEGCAAGQPKIRASRKRRRDKGSIIVVVLVSLVCVLVMAAALMDEANGTFAQERHLRMVAQLQALADAGEQYGYWECAVEGKSPGAWTESIGAGSFSVTVTDGTASGTINVVSTGIVNWGGSANSGSDQEIYTETRIYSLALPSAPTPLTAFGGKKLVVLEWPSISNASSYELLRGATPKSLSVVQTGLTSTVYIDTGLKAGTTYYYEVESVNAGGESAPSNLATAKATSKLMNVTVTGSVAGENLTEEGLTDWAHWGPDPIDRNSSGGSQIGNYTLEGGDGPAAYTSTPAYTWTNGTPTVSETATTSAIDLTDTSASYQLALPASTETQVARVYVGADHCATTFTASISDVSTKSYSTSSVTTNTHVDAIYNIVYSANSSNQTVTLTFSVKKARPAKDTPDISLQAVTLY